MPRWQLEGHPRLIPTPPDLFDEWLSLPVTEESPDPRFRVRPAREEDFERIYDCVDEGFGRKRPRAMFDWMYRANPYGRARMWITEEVSSGRLLKTGGIFPWPIWRGDDPRMGGLGGDAATVPDWQRKGLSAIRRVVRRSHPWGKSMTTFAGPNQGSRIVMKKAGEDSGLLGALRGGVAVLRAAPLFERAGVPGAFARVGGAIATPIFSAWSRLGARADAATRLIEIDRFTTDLDDVTLRTMHFPKYWCPHNAAWLNWRYLDHPFESYSAFALTVDERPVAYSVLRLAGAEASLSEFAAEPAHAGALMAETLRVARESGAAWVNFFATPGWRHWPVFRRAGFLPYTTNNYFEAKDWLDQEASERFDAWQVTPGDRDYH